MKLISNKLITKIKKLINLPEMHQISPSLYRGRRGQKQLFTIHIENQYVTREKRRPRGHRSNVVPIYANVDLKTRAHAYYVHNHFQVFQDMPDVTLTWAECLYEWRAEGKISPIVDLAFSAVALLVFAHFQNC